MCRFLLCWLLLVAWLVFFAGAGLRAWFTPDDLMNLYGVSGKGPAPILAGERPAANLALKGLWTAFRFHPRPYRVFCFALLTLNLSLALCLFRQSGASWTAAFPAGLLFAYHAQFTDLYFNTGTIYDLLCFSFYFSAIFLYLRLRCRGRVPSWRESLTITLLAALAAASKEMAVTLPLLAAGAEWLYGDRGHWRTTALAAAACWLVTLTTTLRSSLPSNPAYRPALTWSTLQTRWTHYTADLLYRGPTWSPAGAWIFLALCAAVAFWLRRREAWWALVILCCAPLPLLFVPPRSFYVFYIPYAGFCLLAGLLLEHLIRLAWPRGALGPAVVWLSLALFLAPQHLWLSGVVRRFYYEYEARTAAPGNALRRGWPPLPRGASVYFALDPFPAPPDEPHFLLFLCRLTSLDPTLTVHRAKDPAQAVPEPGWSRYTAVFRLTRDSLVRIR